MGSSPSILVAAADCLTHYPLFAQASSPHFKASHAIDIMIINPPVSRFFFFQISLTRTPFSSQRMRPQQPPTPRFSFLSLPCCMFLEVLSKAFFLTRANPPLPNLDGLPPSAPPVFPDHLPGRRLSELALMRNFFSELCWPDSSATKFEFPALASPNRRELLYPLFLNTPDSETLLSPGCRNPDARSPVLCNAPASLFPGLLEIETIYFPSSSTTQMSVSLVGCPGDFPTVSPFLARPFFRSRCAPILMV